MPLRTAWAITIHKSQGLTFDHAIINAGRAFSHGQVYVALSRCRTLEGLVLATPIPPDVITTDPSLQPFHTYTEAHTPTPERFVADRHAFVGELLCDVFDFSTISMLMRHFLRLAAEYTPYFPAYVNTIQAAATQVDARLAAVGVRFQQQIRQLRPLADSYSANSALRERVRAAMAYYCRETAAALSELLDAELPEIDNARGKELMEKQLTDLRTAFNVKMNIFIACINDFSLDAYFDAKARAHVAEAPAKKSRMRSAKPTKERTPAKTKSKNIISATTGTTGTSPLYRALLDWRRAVAAERHLPPAYIMSMKTVVAIDEAQPLTKDDLSDLPGIGPKTIEAYGADLLEIVRSNR